MTQAKERRRKKKKRKKERKKERSKHPRTWSIATSFSFTDRRHGKRREQGWDMHAKQSIKQSHTHTQKQTTQTNEANTHLTT
jgi:hypothetical protein